MIYPHSFVHFHLLKPVAKISGDSNSSVGGRGMSRWKLPGNLRYWHLFAWKLRSKVRVDRIVFDQTWMGLRSVPEQFLCCRLFWYVDNLRQRITSDLRLYS